MIGTITQLKVVQKSASQIYLANRSSVKILLVDPKKTNSCELGDSLEVFVYVDPEGHLAATAQLPLAQAGDVAWLKVVAVNYYGAFLEWGLPKNLLVPFSEQHYELEAGKSYLVKVFLDDKNRLTASTKLDKWLSDESIDFKEGQKVSLLIADQTELGIKAIVNNSHWGLLYPNELFQPVKKGQKLDGYIKRIRDDHKIDLTLHQPGYGKVTSLEDRILAKLHECNGILMLSDKSPPEAIYQTFGVSKKVYKQAIGALYRKKLITVEATAIRLPQNL